MIERYRKKIADLIEESAIQRQQVLVRLTAESERGGLSLESSRAILAEVVDIAGDVLIDVNKGLLRGKGKIKVEKAKFSPREVDTVYGWQNENTVIPARYARYLSLSCSSPTLNFRFMAATYSPLMAVLSEMKRPPDFTSHAEFKVGAIETDISKGFYSRQDFRGHFENFVCERVYSAFRNQL